ncbi:MAG TPA: acyclic terpene utilization AtuA family protein [bacterium]|nr:acyclic terpene utilization AtuA family protein [bacterium]
MRRDLQHMLAAARNARIPLLIGSAATGGADNQLSVVVGMAEDIAKQAGQHFRLGVIHSEPARDYLREKYHNKKIRPLGTAPSIDESVFDRSAHIVAVAGVEPFQAALDLGADVVISGRSTDASIFAAIPTRAGLAPGPVWHAAKVLECGAAAVVNRKYSDPLVAWIRDDHFVIEPPNPDYRCTPLSVASHSLYENGSPTELVEPSGTLYLDRVTYEAINERAVKVSGSRFESSDTYTVKLEGAELVGYQTVVIGSIRDPVILRQLESWLEGMQGTARQRLEEIFGTDDAASIQIGVRRYGVNGTLGKLEPDPRISHEVALVFEVTAHSQDLATSAAKAVTHIASHYAVPEWSGLISALAFPHSPTELNRGPVYRFNFNHVLELEDPLEPFSIETLNI